MAASFLPEFTPAEWREKSRLAREAAKKEPNLLLSQALAGHALDMAQLAEMIERQRRAPYSPAYPAGDPPASHQTAKANDRAPRR